MHHSQSIDVWRLTESPTVKVHDHSNPEITWHVVASANTCWFPRISWYTSHTMRSRSGIKTLNEARLPSNWRLWEMGDICHIPSNCSRFLTDSSRSSSPVYHPPIAQHLCLMEIIGIWFMGILLSSGLLVESAVSASASISSIFYRSYRTISVRAS